VADVPEETKQNYKKCTTDKHKWPTENSNVHIFFFLKGLYCIISI